MDEYLTLGEEIVEGVVLNPIRMPVEGAQVSVENTPLWTETDEDGRYAPCSNRQFGMAAFFDTPSAIRYRIDIA